MAPKCLRCGFFLVWRNFPFSQLMLEPFSEFYGFRSTVGFLRSNLRFSSFSNPNELFA